MKIDKEIAIEYARYMLAGAVTGCALFGVHVAMWGNVVCTC